MEDPNILNIPAYQRKRSLAAKARKKITFPKAKKTISKRKKTPSPRSRFLGEEALTDIPIHPTTIMPSQQLFTEPYEEYDEPKRENPEIREMKTCGMCEGYFDKINVAIIKVTSPIRQGDILIFEKNGGLFEQEINSMQIDRKDVSLAKSGSDIGVKVSIKPLVGTQVYKVI